MLCVFVKQRREVPRLQDVVTTRFLTAPGHTLFMG